MDCADLVTSLKDVESKKFLSIVRNIKNMVNRDWVVVIQSVPRSCVNVIDDPHKEMETLLVRDSMFTLTCFLVFYYFSHK